MIIFSRHVNLSSFLTFLCSAPMCLKEDCGEILAKEDGAYVSFVMCVYVICICVCACVLTVHMYIRTILTNTCRPSLSLQYFPDHFVRKDINKMKINCKYCTKGCNWTGKYGELQVIFVC